jgi:hypothetical protein
LLGNFRTNRATDGEGAIQFLVVSAGIDGGEDGKKRLAGVERNLGRLGRQTGTRDYGDKGRTN